MTEYERFELVFTKTRVYKFGHRCHPKQCTCKTPAKDVATTGVVDTSGQFDTGTVMEEHGATVRM